MMQFGLIGLGAGAAAALLFASVTSGTLLSIPLAYLAPLPIMIAALGWSHWAAMIGVLLGAAAIGLFFGGLFAVAFLTGVGLPAWWLGYLTMLARPVGSNGTASLEWYPPGRLVVWAAILAATLVILGIFTLGVDGESFQNALRTSLREIFRLAANETGSAAPETFKNPDRLIDVMVAAIPPGTAVMGTISYIINLWLAGRVVKFSGRMTRPWPDVAAMTFPPLVSVSLAVAIALSFLDGMVGIVAGVISASLLMAYGVLGFAVIHSITAGMTSRGFILAGVYASVLVFGWPVLGLCLLGLAETIFNFRARADRKRGARTST